MKKNILIVIAVLVANILAQTAKAQTEANAKMKDEIAASFTDIKTGKNTTIILIADETVLITADTSVRIECNNETVFNKLFKTHSQLFRRFTCQWKTNCDGKYKHYIIYLSKGDSEIIRKWSKTNL